MSRSLTKKFKKLQKRLTGNSAQLYVFAAFMIIVFLLGGSSRDDVQSLVILRPLAIVFGVYALTCKDREAWKGRTFPLYVALALAGLMLLQLIPLPPSIWTNLPGRQIFANIADLAGMEQPWRPLTLSPSRTLNSLFSLVVPVSAMMLYLNLDKNRRKQAVAIIIALAGASALWAILQLTGSARGPFYLYNITNNGAAVGLFANRNHQAVFLAASIVMLGWYGASHSVATKLAALKFYSSIAAIFVFVPLIFVTGSRAGLLLMIPALIAAIILIYYGRYTLESQPAANSRRSKKKRFALRQIILIASSSMIMIMAALSIYFSRSLAYDRLLGGSGATELRLQLVPIFSRMLGDYFPWGSGFGTFEHVYRIYEPHDFLNPSYLNQAHNDWFQLPIEGGLPVIIIAAVVVIWALRQCLTLLKNWKHSRYSKYAPAMAAIVILLFLAASIGDYPLRIPSLIAVFAVSACIFTDGVRAVRRTET
ncbi:O-antigen ligase family protein [Parasphingorhabdus sp. JC815]|uniref:O-antigen ligase family protein n=1 Tax=Parasphingorhabdus sp. JC815 TaxID=3232140 RepID=UPI00345ACCB4